MAIVLTCITDSASYQTALDTKLPVFMLFMSHDCSACQGSDVLFERVAERYRDKASFYRLDTRKTPRHQAVDIIPTVLVFKDGKLIDTFLKLRVYAYKEGALEQLFALHTGDVGQPAPTPPEP